MAICEELADGESGCRQLDHGGCAVILERNPPHLDTVWPLEGFAVFGSKVDDRCDPLTRQALGLAGRGGGADPESRDDARGIGAPT
jgi:hypothetical protein